MPTIQSFLDYSQKVTKRKINMADIAKALNTSRSNITHKAKRETELKLSELKLIVEYLQIDKPAQFLNGLLEVDGRLNKTSIGESYMTDEAENTVNMDYYPDVFGSCGAGAFVFSEHKEVLQVPKRCIKSYSGFKKYSVINATGDSMTPYIFDKDKLVLEHWQGEQIRDNRIYLFRYGDNIFIKRLILNVDQIIIKSDNKEYAPRYIDKENMADFQIIGRIVGIWREEL